MVVPALSDDYVNFVSGIVLNLIDSFYDVYAEIFRGLVFINKRSPERGASYLKPAN